MKLIEIDIYAFGGLKELKIHLSDKINVINKENGWGKTTLAVFIKSMFYGLNDSKFSLKENERKKYRPWNFSEKFGGSLTFESDGKILKITRLFGDKNSSDEFTLIDVETGKVILNKADRFGEEIFGIDQAGFFSTLYHCQKEFDLSNGKLLSEKFSSNYSDGEYDFQKAIQIIENKAKTFKAERGDKGLLSELRDKIIRLDAKIENANQISSTILELKNTEKQLVIDAEKKKSEILSLTEKISERAKNDVGIVNRDKLNSLHAEKQKTLNQIALLDKVFCGNETNKEEVETYLSCAKDLINVKAKEEAQISDLNKIKTTMARASFLIVLSVIFAIIGVVGIFVNIILSISSGCLFALLLIIGIVLKVGGAKALKEQNEYANISKTYLDKINAFLQLFNFEKTGDYIGDLLYILDATNQKARLFEKIKVINAEISHLDGVLCEKNSQNKKNSLLELQNEINKKEMEYSLLQDKIHQIRARVLMLAEEESVLPDLIAERESTEKELAKANEEYQVLKLTAEYLKKANEKMRSKYKNPLEQRLNYYIDLICGENQFDASIDLDFNVTFNSKGKARETEYFSKGINDVVNICKRFALSDVIFEGKSPFIVLDDPFCNLDENRLQDGLKILEMLAKEKQIIYFTCHESRTVKNNG